MENKFDLIIVNGDSFADGGGVVEQYKFENGTYSPDTKLSWASFLSESLNIPLVNIAMGGSSNKVIFEKNVDFINQSGVMYYDSNESDIKNFKKLNIDIKTAKILWITSWTYVHRLYIPLLIQKNSEFINQNISLTTTIDSNFENYLIRNKFDNPSYLFDCVKKMNIGLTGLSDYGYHFREFLNTYYLNNKIITSYNNITHFNWLYVPFSYYKNEPKNDGINYFNWLENKLLEFDFNLINREDVYMNDLRTCTQETNGKLDDTHIGLHSSKLMANRLFDYLKQKYGI